MDHHAEPTIDALLSFNVLGLDWIPGFLLRRFFYRDLADLAPEGGPMGESTPMVNDDVLEQI
jgi:hypothetical protein